MAHEIRHISVLDEKLKQEIEGVLDKLKSPRTKRQVQSWLENFEAEEIYFALNFLLFLDYITFEDLQSRLEPLIRQIEKEMADNDVLFIPYGKYVKSNDLIMYCINKSATFKKYYNRNKFQYTRDILQVRLEKPTILVYVDDFIGSGKSFIKWYKKKDLQAWVKDNASNIVGQILLCPEIMFDGQTFIKDQHPDIDMFGSIRNKIFNAETSPFRGLGNLEQMKELCIKYGKKIPVAFSYPDKVYAPLGYDNTESLLAFDYGTPNNTLPIIWGSSNWQPIFPRVGNDRIKMVTQVKKDSSQFIGIIRKFGINITEDERIVRGHKPIFLNKQEDYGLLCFLIFKKHNYSNAEISQNIGISIQILDDIIRYGKRQKLIDKDENLTKVGNDLLKEIFTHAHKFRENDSLNDKSKMLYVPSSFNNTT